MTVGAPEVVYPPCPQEAHAGFLVWRDGFHGKAPARRQRFRCVNPQDSSDWHAFTPPVLRAEAHEHRCLDCQQYVPSHAGPAVPGGYHYLSKVVAGALGAVANGRTYSEASQAARRALAHAAGLGPADGTREFSVNGQLAADWTEVFTDVVVTQPEHWPAVVLLDATKFHRRAAGAKVHAFTLLFAYGYDVYEGPQAKPPDQDPGKQQETDDGMPFGDGPAEVAADRAVNGRLLRIGLVAKEDEARWAEFLSGWTGTPQVVVGDGARGAKNAVETIWPGRVSWVRCVYHWQQNLMSAVLGDLARLTGLASGSKTVQQDELLVQTRAAFASPAAFREFQAAARQRFGRHAEFAELPASSLVWLRTNGKAALTQLADAGTRPGPQSIGPLEQVILRTRQQVAGRAQSLRNPARTQLMLTLLAAGSRNDANVDIWAGLIYAHLAANGSRPALRQRGVAGHTMSELASPQPKSVKHKIPA
jgi:hypothetical protein